MIEQVNHATHPSKLETEKTQEFALFFFGFRLSAQHLPIVTATADMPTAHAHRDTEHTVIEMKRRLAIPRAPRLFTRVALALIVCLSSSVIVSTHSSAHIAHVRDKVSKDLRARMQQAGGARVNVIVQPSGTWNSSLDSAVKGNNGSVKHSFRNFSHRVVSLPAWAVDELASRSDVGYITLDREVKQLGHITLTSGADTARAMSNDTTLDGAGIGIVIMDSGIDPDHDAFNDGAGNSRIVANVDFTNASSQPTPQPTLQPTPQPSPSASPDPSPSPSPDSSPVPTPQPSPSPAPTTTTNDLYGHGTHVAGTIAALRNGAGLVGIAPKTHLFAVKVLDSQGGGSSSDVIAENGRLHSFGNDAD